MERTLQFPEVADRHAANLARWEEVCADPSLAARPERIETDGAGNVIMTPPPGFSHSSRQFRIGDGINRILQRGQVLTECPISTSDGVRAADVAWLTDARADRGRSGEVLVEAPEICVEVLSPSNTRREIEHKRRPYFEAGADEVRVCDLDGRMFFFTNAPEVPAPRSALCPSFPEEVPQR